LIPNACGEKPPQLSGVSHFWAIENLPIKPILSAIDKKIKSELASRSTKTIAPFTKNQLD
jgi:hypothetical protein